MSDRVSEKKVFLCGNGVWEMARLSWGAAHREYGTDWIRGLSGSGGTTFNDNKNGQCH